MEGLIHGGAYFRNHCGISYDWIINITGDSEHEHALPKKILILHPYLPKEAVVERFDLFGKKSGKEHSGEGLTHSGYYREIKNLLLLHEGYIYLA